MRNTSNYIKKFYYELTERIGIRRKNWDDLVSNFQNYVSKYTETYHSSLQYERKTRIVRSKEPLSFDETVYNYFNCDSFFVKPLNMTTDISIRIDRKKSNQTSLDIQKCEIESAITEFRQLPNGMVAVIIFPAKCNLCAIKNSPFLYKTVKMNKKISARFV